MRWCQRHCYRASGPGIWTRLHRCVPFPAGGVERDLISVSPLRVGETVPPVANTRQVPRTGDGGLPGAALSKCLSHGVVPNPGLPIAYFGCSSYRTSHSSGNRLTAAAPDRRYAPLRNFYRPVKFLRCRVLVRPRQRRRQPLREARALLRIRWSNRSSRGAVL